MTRSQTAIPQKTSIRETTAMPHRGQSLKTGNDRTDVARLSQYFIDRFAPSTVTGGLQPPADSPRWRNEPRHRGANGAQRTSTSACSRTEPYIVPNVVEVHRKVNAFAEPEVMVAAVTSTGRHCSTASMSTRSWRRTGAERESARSQALTPIARCTDATALAPSPTAAATRFIDPCLTSPAANRPGTLVSNGSGSRPSALHVAPSVTVSS